jgi:surface protein
MAEGFITRRGGTSAAPAEDWVRPADWLTLPTVGDTEQKFVGLMAITDDDSNFAALLARGAYTVDWGDGTIEDIADNVQAQHSYDYSAISNATLSSRGYKQVIITVTPQGAGNLTLININLKHSQSGLQAYETGWLDIEVGSPNFGTGASIVIGGAETVRMRWLERVRVANAGGMTSAANMFQNCVALQSVPLFNTASVTSMSLMFNACSSLQSVPLFNTASVTTMANMFNTCRALQSVPLFNTASVTTMAGMFSGCFAFQSVPLFNTASVTTMAGMFSSCLALQSVPLFNTSSVTTMAGMFNNGSTLQSVPLFNTSSVTTMASMFSGCFALQSVPLFNTASVTTMAGMFQSCSALQSVPLFNTASVATMANMFNGCSTLQSVPAFDASAVTSSAGFNGMFLNNNSLSSMRATGINYTFSLENCKLSAVQLDAIYTALPTVVGQTITVKGNWGISGHTPSIAELKGWTVSVA